VLLFTNWKKKRPWAKTIGAFEVSDPAAEPKIPAKQLLFYLDSFTERLTNSILARLIPYRA
jgi:hypothetical protein